MGGCAVLGYDEMLGVARIGITDRFGGASIASYTSLNLGDHVGDDPVAVAANRATVAALAGVGDLVFMTQVHGTAVVVLDGVPSTAPTADAMVTAQAGVALAVLVADCAPVVLVDVEQGVIGVAHAGRVGLVDGVLDATVQAMRDLGAHTIEARVGPAICGHCYEVPPEMAAYVGARIPAVAAKTRWGTPGIDLGTGAVAELARLGVHATRAGGCTYESAAHFSYRRDGVTGRFGAFVVLEA